MPKGPFRVYRIDTDGRREFVGRDSIDHTPKDERVRVRIGTAFDLVGERVRTDEKRPSPRSLIQTYRIRLRNHKDEAAQVEVIEHLLGHRNWRITAHSDPFTKKDFRTIRFDVDVAANSEKQITYTVFYDR